jgi:hypothetical protein
MVKFSTDQKVIDTQGQSTGQVDRVEKNLSISFEEAQT